MKSIGRLLVCLCLPFVPLNGAADLSADARMHKADAGRSHELESGRSLYNFYCYYCHGYAGDAQTLAAKFLSPPPRNFLQADPEVLTPDRIRGSISEGRAGTAMQPFRWTLTEDEIKAVAAYVYTAFVKDKRPNTRYHTVENGWHDHDRFRESYPFATGEIPLDTPSEILSESQRRGLQVYLQSCVSCHDRSRVDEPDVTWEPVANSYPRIGFKPGDDRLPADAISAASPFSRHEVVPLITDLSPTERMGEALFQQNCAFCHAADGTGKNWIGTFLIPHPRDLTDSGFMSGMTRSKLKQVIREGLQGTSMPAWKTVLSDSQIDSIIGYIHRAIHPLSGTSD